MALGSNVRHPRHGPPRRVIAAALDELEAAGAEIVAHSAIFDTAPLGPSNRRYANAAAMIETALPPEEMLSVLQRIERAFGRRRRGRRWRARVLDLDLVLWSGGTHRSPRLTIPHPEFRRRTFVLTPAAAIASRWRDPATGLTPRHLHARLTRPRALPR
ncbi:2-amino-4-hydroxy-6-hydroxymethyldihydropteridine diphosphokinase [Pelagerythrobacter aerophilus]|uniref:2-amino-4-hydroxy-6- hydroxymethyldihydropteridine diphosphokinase n=1 Tax=Pelagerythrobacter aerophilus TaxID=2306995 RepID=UPI001E6040E0|nr:2-amino-4-hydroxy-6-hydroxymethyldihydropteridine diphosphokinase [Pelagerythrobacter aerophilus]